MRYSVDQYLKTVRNIQTKWKLLCWLRQHNAAQPNIGIEYSQDHYRRVYIY